MNSVFGSFGSNNGKERPEHAPLSVEALRGMRINKVNTFIEKTYGAIAFANPKMVAETHQIVEDIRAAREARRGNVTALQQFTVQSAANAEAQAPVAEPQQEAFDAFTQDDNVTSIRAYINSLQSEEPPRDVAA